MDALDAPGHISFQDLDPLAGSLQGSMTIQRAVSEATVQSYEIYWATGDGASAPTGLTLFASLPLTSLSSTVSLVMAMRDSWGDGWNNAYYYIRSADGMELASGTLVEGRYGEDIINVTSSTNLLLTVTRGNWPLEMSWELRLATAPAGEGTLLTSDNDRWPTDLAFSVGTSGSGVPVETSVPAGTLLPSGANHFLTFSRLTSGAASSSSWTAIVDFVPPASSPTSLAFTDTDGNVGIIAGQITVGRATDETGISEYKIYFGISSSSKVPSATAIASISASTNPLVATLSATTIPMTATYLLAFSASSSGENSQPVFVLLSDLQLPTSPPSNVTFVDAEPLAGYYAGVVSFLRAPIESAITHYQVFWGSTSSTPDFSLGLLGNVSVSGYWSTLSIYINSTQAPSGITHLVVVSANEAYSMPTGSGVLLVDYATITVVPSSVNFSDTDASLAKIGGTVTIGAASDESEVVDYAVYWGASSSVKSPGGSHGLTAEFFVMASCPSASSFVDFSTLGAPFLQRIDTVSSYGPARPGGSLSIWPGLNQSELFAARWTGWFQIISGSSYWLQVDSDDGSRVFIDGIQVSSGFVTLSSGIHDVELQYFQCFGSSYVQVTGSGPDTGYMSVSLWDFGRHGVKEQTPIVTASKNSGSSVVATIPVGTNIPSSASHLLVFARAAGGFDSFNSLGIEIVDLVKPVVTAQYMNFSDTDPAPNMIQGILTIARAQDESNLNFYKIYWGSSATEILNGTRRLQNALSAGPTCSGITCTAITITAGTNANEWVVSRGSYNNNEQAFITLIGPAEVQFTMLSTETCCDKLTFPSLSSPISGYTLPGVITLPDGTHSIEWYSDFSVTTFGWSFTYKYVGIESSNPSLIAMIPKPSGSQDLAVLIENQALAGTHFIVKTAYNSTESDNSVAIQVVDLSPPVLDVGAVIFLDTNTAAGIISGSVTIAAGSSDITGFNIYWGRDSNNTIAMGNPGLLGEFFYLSSSPTSIPTLSGTPDVVQVEAQLNQPETTNTWPGLSVSENFAALWTGYINITTGGSYFFTLSSDDGSQLYINNALVVDNDGLHGFQSLTSQGVYLLPGLQSLQVRFFNGGGGYGIVLAYNGPDTSNLRITVPASVLRHGSLTNALIGSVAAASGDSVFQIQNLGIPQEASHILVRGYTAAGEGATSSSAVIRDAFSPTVTANAVYFTDVDPLPGQVGGTIILEGAANQSSISHYVIYWGSSATSKLSTVPIGEIASSGGSGSSTGLSCGVKGADSTPLRFLRNGFNGPKIVNGQAATECEWRWQASLRFASGFAFCGGALISSKWVMTAAHCVDGAASFVVVFGDFDKDSNQDQHATTYGVQRIIPHESYNSQTFDNDFALLELDQEVDMGECIATVCLPEAEVPVGAECFITGWGTLSSGGSTPSALQEGMVFTLSNDACNAGEGYGGQITGNMLCAQGTASGGIVDACQGDSGGPLVCAGTDGRYVLHGATSWGYGCAVSQYPGVYARISQVLPWVKQHTGLEPGVGSGNLTYNISNQSIPTSATHLLVYTAMNGVEMTTGISIPIVDYAPVQAIPTSISFTDTDASPGELGGTITLGRASDESQVVGYAVFWGTASVVMDLILEVPKGSGGTTVALELPANTLKPTAATHLLGYVSSTNGFGASFVSVPIVDLDSSLVSGGLTFHDTDPGASQVGGIVTVQRAAATTGITAYNLYFSSGSCNVVGSQITSLPVSPGGGGPLCIQGATCSSIIISEETPGTYAISRGMSGYQNFEHAIIQVQGPGTVTFSRFDTESGYDTLRVDEASFSGNILPPDQILGVGMKVIEWSSDLSVTGQGWALTYTPESVFGDIIYTLPSTAIPSGANSMIVLSQTSSGENAAACAATALVDFAPPSVGAQALWFSDENPSAGRVTGTLTILQARSHDGVSEYRIYWGMNSTTPLSGSSMLLAVTATTAGTNLTVNLNDTSLPTNASHLLAFAASSQGESASAASTEVMDYAPAQQAAESVNFTDTDPRAGFVTGTAYIARAQDESTIDNYNLYFSSGSTKISFIATMEADAGAQRPSCTGQSCSQISITQVTGKFEVSRGTSSYDNNEYASIVVSGPGRIQFNFFNTELRYDTLTILGIDYSGTEVPAEISIPSGTHEIIWRSDVSVTQRGWKFMYESLRLVNVGIEVPPTAIPAGVSHLLVLSNSSGGEMTSGVTTPLFDYNPPNVVPESVQCQDNDNSIGLIQGSCTVTRASDESGVSAYEIFWGNATHPFSPSLGRVVLAGLTGSQITIPFAQFLAAPAATHLLAVAVGPGGAAVTGASTLVVDNVGLTLSTTSLDVVGMQNSTSNQTITLANAGSSVTLNIQLLMEDGSANGVGSGTSGTSGTSSGTASSGSNSLLSNLPSACLEGASSIPKSRLIYKMKTGTASGRRLSHARKLESRHGAKVKSFQRLGGLAVAEIKNASVESYCRLYTELDHDPLVDFVEEDQTWYATGNTIQVQPEYDLFPPGGKVPSPGPRRGQMHRQAPQCQLGGCQGGMATHPNDGSYEDLWGMHQENDVDIDAPEAWSIHKGLSGQVIVAVIDTGVDYNHEDLRNQMLLDFPREPLPF